MIAKLIPNDGTEAILINRNLTIVGRKKGLCDLVLNSSSISKVHCAVAKTDGLLFIRDLGSTNGTKVNGQRVSRGALLPGDEIAFANVKFRVHLGPGDAADPERTEKLLTLPGQSGQPSSQQFAGIDSNDLPLFSSDEN